MKKIKFKYIILFLIPILFFIQYNLRIDNDFWFTIKEGEYVINNGFPNVVPFTIYDNLNFIYQSYGAGVIFSFIYKLLGTYGILFFVIFILIIMTYFYYRLCVKVSNNNENISILVTVITMSLLAVNYITTRPQIFTYLNLIIVLYIMELYSNTNNRKYLYILPIISLIQSNIHCMFFFMLIIFMLPYIFNNSKEYEIKPILVTMLFMILTGLINPYGINNLLYVFNSYGQNILEKTIKELQPLSFSSLFGKIHIFIILIIYILYFKSRKKIPIRYLLLLFGTTYLAFDTLRGVSLFIIGSFFPLAYLYKDIPNIDISKYIPKIIKVLITITLFIISLIIIFIPRNYYPDAKEPIDYLVNNYKISDIKLYTSFSDGSYAVYKGIKCSMDPRAEVFLKKNNHKFDIYKEYYDLQMGIIDYNEYLKKYNFTHLLINKKDYLYNKLEKNSYNYIAIKEYKNYKIYIRKDLLN